MTLLSCEDIEDYTSQDSTFHVGNSTFDNIVKPPHERGEFLKAIDVLETYEKDWDGNDSLPPSAEALGATRFFIESLPWQREFPDIIYPGCDESVVLEWKKGSDGCAILLTFDPYFVGAVKINNDGDVTSIGNFNFYPSELGLPKAIQNLAPRSHR